MNHNTKLQLYRQMLSNTDVVDQMPTLIRLCTHSDESRVFRTIRILLSSHYRYSPNVCDAFGCSLLMYSLRYKHFHLFEYLLNQTCLNVDLNAKDQLGNTILHYAVLYDNYDVSIFDKLLEKYKKFSINIDQRNTFGFTPLLLAAYFQRYDLILILLTRSNASPFACDDIHSKNMFDYIENNKKYQISTKPIESREIKRLQVQFYQTIPSRCKTALNSRNNNFRIEKNLFETILSQIFQDPTGLLRFEFIKMLNMHDSSSNLFKLQCYINQRYPKIRNKKQIYDSTELQKGKCEFERDSSKIEIHRILNLYDPNPRPPARPPSPQRNSNSMGTASIIKAPLTFKRLSNKITTLATFTRIQGERKRSSVSSINNIKQKLA